MTDPNFEVKDSFKFHSVYDDNGINNILKNITEYKNYSNILQISKRTLDLDSNNHKGIDTTYLNIIKEKNLTKIILNELTNFDITMTESGDNVILSLIFGKIGPIPIFICISIRCLLLCDR